MSAVQPSTPPGIPAFDPAFALAYMLPFAEAAYDIAAGKTPLMPPGYAVKSIIKADPQRTAEVMASIPLPHQRMVRAMVATNPIMGFVGRNATTQTAIVSFRGTETPEDWLKDFDSLAVPFPDVANSGLVHQGFDAVYRTIRDSVIAGVGAVKVNTKSMWITGHRLGGAFALLAALDFGKSAVPPLISQVIHSPGRVWATTHSRTSSTPPSRCATGCGTDGILCPSCRRRRCLFTSDKESKSTVASRSTSPKPTAWKIHTSPACLSFNRAGRMLRVSNSNTAERLPPPFPKPSPARF